MNTQPIRKERRLKQHPCPSLTGLHYFTEEQKREYYALCTTSESEWSDKDRARYNELVLFSSQLDKAYWAGQFSRRSITH